MSAQSLRRQGAGETGSALPLVGGAVLLLLAIIFGVTSATSLLIERQRLYSLADAAAVFAAESFAPADVRPGTSGIVAPLTNSGVYQATVFYLHSVGEGSLSEVQLDQAITPNGRRADVTLSSLWSPPVVSDFFPSMVRLSVTAHSQVFIQ